MSDLSKKSLGELLREAAQKREAIRKFRFDTAGSKIKNVKEGHIFKKDLARILTEINFRQKQEKITNKEYGK